MPPPLPIEPTSSTGSDTEMQEDTTPRIQQIYITVLEIPVVYQSVMQITPGLHAKPPVLPPPIDPAFAPVHLPPNGFDFIFHVGVAGRGPLRLEKLAHKLGYRMKDAEGQYAPIVHVPKDVPKDPEQEVPDFMGKALLPPADLGLPPSGLPKGVVAGDESHIGDDRPVETPEAQPTRGFGKPYESMPDELYTEIDVPRLILHLKEQGIQVRRSPALGPSIVLTLFYRDPTRAWTLVITCPTSCTTRAWLRRGATRQSRRRTRCEVPHPR